MTTCILDKLELPKPCDVQASINELRHWREVRYSRDLTTGALDNAIAYLDHFYGILNMVYLRDLEEDGRDQLDMFDEL